MDREWGHFHATTCTSVRESCKQGVIGNENTPQAIVCDGGRIYTEGHGGTRKVVLDEGRWKGPKRGRIEGVGACRWEHI